MTALQELQKQFALIDFCGEIRIVKCSDIDTNNPHGFSFYSRADAKIMMTRALEKLPLASKTQETLDQFYRSPKTKLFLGTAFSPKAMRSDLLNFWRPPKTGKAGGNFDAIKTHLKTVICGGDKGKLLYLLNFLAHMLQKPEDKPGVMIVSLGAQGTGKGLFFSLLKAIWHQTTLHASQVEQVVGRFNASLEKNYVICLDEALFAGDRKSLDHLKSLITEPYINIEQKYQPSRNIESVHRFFAASNHEHFAHIEMDDRRFLFLNVSDCKKSNFEYFRKLHKTIEDDASIQSFIEFLLRVDLTKFNVRNKPKTNEHLQQRLRSLGGFERFWYEALSTGSIAPHNPFQAPESDWADGFFISTLQLIERYTSFDKNAQKHQTIQSEKIHQELTRLCPSALKVRQVVSGHNKRGFKLPPLKIARKEFENRIGASLSWL